MGRHWQWWCCYWSHHHPLEVSFSKFPSNSLAGSESLHGPDIPLQSRIWARVWRIPSLYHILRPSDYTTDNRVLSRHNTGSLWLVTVQSVIKIQDTAPSPPHLSANTGHFSPGLTYNRLKIPTYHFKFYVTGSRVERCPGLAQSDPVRPVSVSRYQDTRPAVSPTHTTVNTGIFLINFWPGQVRLIVIVMDNYQTQLCISRKFTCKSRWN